MPADFTHATPDKRPSPSNSSFLPHVNVSSFINQAHRLQFTIRARPKCGLAVPSPALAGGQGYGKYRRLTKLVPCLLITPQAVWSQLLWHHRSGNATSSCAPLYHMLGYFKSRPSASQLIPEFARSNVSLFVRAASDTTSRVAIEQVPHLISDSISNHTITKHYA